MASSMSATGSKRKKKDKPAPAPALAVTVKPAVQRVPMSEVIAALSHALDMTEGSPKGHSIRTCMIGMRIGRAAGLAPEALADLYYALLLKDAGCSSNASRMASLFGSDDQYVKPRLKAVDWHDRRQLAIETWQVMARGGTLWTRVRHFLGVAQQPTVTRELIASRCERGGSIARRLGFPEATALAIQSLDEHWNGKGHPQGLAGEAIPVLSRITNLAQTIEAFLAKGDRTAADAVLVARRGRWFDPSLTDVAREVLCDDAWCESLRSPEIDAVVLQLEPGHARMVDAAGLDQIAEAFADIVDAKSPFTHRHSTMVAAYAVAIAQQMGFDREGLRQMYRAGLLHDIGKLGVSSRILDKPGQLDTRERAELKEHPRYTWEILKRVNAFESFALLAALHHEKLDGSGYPWGRMEEDLDMPARILAVADIYEAVTETRAYRVGLSSGEAMQILRVHAGFRLDADAIDALAAAIAVDPPAPEPNGSL
jgi:putative nucleotidyltransferase with HDIG domain